MLCRFIGYLYEPSALQYWNFPHHGLGGNGAASLYLRGRQVTNFETADDEYYAGLIHKDVESDRRWIDALDRDTCCRFLDAPYTKHVRAQLPCELDWLRP